MSTIEQLPTIASERSRPMRADARRNFEKVLASARDAFAAGGSATSLEEIARQAGVGIGTLYRHFPNRQALLEAVYAEEVVSLCRSAGDFAELEPWDALVAWLHGFVGYMATKQALAAELLDYMERDSPLFTGCRSAMYTAGEPLLRRAQEAGVVREDANLPDVIQMVAGIAKIQTGDPGQIERILDIALDGLRANP
ncbi:MAG: helix-turn-helix domain-containing protein [Solirubrobacteraceae bacterium]